ncbi:ferritin-like domain-containing protein [Hymenobacter sp. B81]|uniref:ferritin-like domain-containing protein n=1 Tax=Hymenobacter sp. B81 TaxID=3344878 RepID=UPI0037DC8002
MSSSLIPAAEPPRRRFLRSAGTAVAASLVLAACGDDPQVEPTSSALISLGSGDAGLLHYLFRLKQWQAAFYQKVTTTPPADLRAGELDTLKEITLHEQIQRDYLLAVGAQNNQTDLFAIGVFSFDTLTLVTREQVLGTARSFEDLAVAAVHGTLPLFTGSLFMQVAAKMASVEARHSTTVRELLVPGSFTAAEVVDPATGLEKTKTVDEVVTELNKYASIPFTAAQLPTS